MSLGTVWSGRSPRERGLIVLGLLVGAVAVYLVAFPEGGAERGALSLAAARSQYRDAAKRKTEDEKQIARLKPIIDTATYKDTSERVMPAVLKTLYEYAARSDIRLREIKPLRPRQISGLTKVSVTVRFTSEFRKVVPFVYYIEDPKGRLVVEKLNVSAPDNKSRMVDVEVQVGLFAAESQPATEGNTRV